jgi:hypothetical protein
VFISNEKLCYYNVTAKLELRTMIVYGHSGFRGRSYLTHERMKHNRNSPGRNSMLNDIGLTISRRSSGLATRVM